MVRNTATNYQPRLRSVLLPGQLNISLENTKALSVSVLS